ncbi:RadC family protein [Thermodesulfobacteriota bacterium]
MNKLKTKTFWEDLKSGLFASMVKEASKGQSVSNSREVYNILKPLFTEHDDVETIYCIFLDAKNNILAIEKMFSGSLTAATVYPREIIKRLIALKASSFVMAHNHPSGDIKPSTEDRSVTIKIGIAAASIDTSFHDHMIIGDGYHSMADSGWLRKVSSRFSDVLKSEMQWEGGKDEYQN